MIQDQGTGTLPDANTAEQPVHHRYGVFTYEIPTAGQNKHLAPETETEVTS